MSPVAQGPIADLLLARHLLETLALDRDMLVVARERPGPLVVPPQPHYCSNAVLLLARVSRGFAGITVIVKTSPKAPSRSRRSHGV